MSEVKKIKFDDMPRWFRLLFALLPVIGFAVIATVPNSDFYFLYPTGEYIVNNGFPVKDFLSMHTGMNIIVQQWLTDVLFYYIFKTLGRAGIIAFVYICYCAFFVLLQRLCLLVSKNSFVSYICAAVVDLIMAMAYMQTRPQIITYLIILVELYLLEKHLQTKKPVFLAFIPLLSLLLINFHASMWFMLFIMAAPYVVSAVPIKLGKIKQEALGSFWMLLAAGAVSFAVGLLNPYGFKAIKYIFTSFGYSEISNFIIEMQPLSPKTAAGCLVCVYLVAVVIALLLFRKGKLATRFVLLFFGTLFMSVLAVKSSPYFLISSAMALSYYFSEKEVAFALPDGKSEQTDKKKVIVLTTLIFVLATAAVVLAIFNPLGSSNDAKKETVLSETEQLDGIVDILDGVDGEIVLFSNFSSGAYLEYNGYHPYIDARAELFLKDNNGEYDYMDEYYQIYKGTIDYNEFLERYDFNYLVVEPLDKGLYENIKADSDYELLYDGGKICLYKLKV